MLVLLLVLVLVLVIVIEPRTGASVRVLKKRSGEAALFAHRTTGDLFVTFPPPWVGQEQSARNGVFNFGWVAPHGNAGM
jgi:hypothetical protein